MKYSKILVWLEKLNRAAAICCDGMSSLSKTQDPIVATIRRTFSCFLVGAVYGGVILMLLLTTGCGKNSSRKNRLSHETTQKREIAVSWEKSPVLAPPKTTTDNCAPCSDSCVLNEILYCQEMRKNEPQTERAKIDWSLREEKAEKYLAEIQPVEQPTEQSAEQSTEQASDVTEFVENVENIVADEQADNPLEPLEVADFPVDEIEPLENEPQIASEEPIPALSRESFQDDVVMELPFAHSLFESGRLEDIETQDFSSLFADMSSETPRDQKIDNLDLNVSPHEIAKIEIPTTTNEQEDLQSEKLDPAPFPVHPHALIVEDLPVINTLNTEIIIPEEEQHVDVASLEENVPEILVYRYDERFEVKTGLQLVQMNDRDARIEQSIEESLKDPETDTPPPWAYGTVADSFLSSNPTHAKRVVNNMQDNIDPNDDPFSFGLGTEAPADSGEEEEESESDPFGGSDDLGLAEETESSEEQLENKGSAAPQKALSEDELAKLNARPENLSAVEEYLLNEAERSPVHMMESIGKLAQMQKPELVKWLMRRFLQKENLAPEDYVRISESVRPEAFNRLISDPVYAPDGPTLVSRILDQTKAFRESKANIEQAVNVYTQSVNATEKEAAIQVILKGGQKGIEVLLEKLIHSNDKNEIAKVSSLLSRMGDDARLAVMELLLLRNESSMRAAAILVQKGKKSDAKLLIPLVYDAKLSESNRKIIEGYIKKLVGRVPSPQHAATQLYTDAMNYYRCRVPFRTVTDYQDNTGASAVSNNRSKVKVWMFREGDLLPHFEICTEKDASRYYAEKYARESAFLVPNNKAYRTLWLSAYFDLKGRETGIDESIYTNEKMLKGILDAYSLAEIENVLRFSMTHDHPIAARVAVELLGKIGNAEELLYKSNSAMVKAAGFNDRRVRFAAVKAIIGLNPQKAYPGSSVVSESLVYFTKSGGIKKAIVASPKTYESQQIASMLLPLGYKSETAMSGKEAMRLAINSADTELMMIDTRTPTKGMNYLLQEMYLDNRTHDVPVAVYASAGDEARGARAVAGAVRARAYYRPHDEATVREIIDHLMTETGVEHVPVDIRLQSAKDAVYWITQLFKQPKIYRFENIEETALQIIWTPELVMEAMELLALIRSVQAQLMLVGIASESLNPIDRRIKAVDAFDESVQNYGVLLRGRQVLDLYDFYNASAGESKESQRLRGRLLDIIEDYADRVSRSRK